MHKRNMKWLAAFDAIAEPTADKTAARMFDRIAFGSLLLLVVAAPHSIAVTQGSWLIGMTAFSVRLCFKP